MTHYHIYTRDESGIIEYKGPQEFESDQQIVEHFLATDETPETEDLLGWPTSRVTWYGNLGIAPV